MPVDPCGGAEGIGALLLPTKLGVLFATSEEQEPLELEAFFVISLDEEFALGRWWLEEDVWWF